MKRKVDAITSSRLRPNPFLTKSEQCPVCRKVFTQTTTHYIFGLHCFTCLLSVTKDKGLLEETKYHKDTIKAERLLKSRFDKCRISWTLGCDDIVIDRENMIENSLVQIDLMNSRKVYHALLLLHLISLITRHNRNGKSYLSENYQPMLEECCESGWVH